MKLSIQVIIITIISQVFFKVNAADFLSFKFNNGQIIYDSNLLDGSSISVASPSLGYFHSLNERSQLGLNFDIFFNLNTKSVVLYGLGCQYKYFFWGEAETMKTETPDFTLKTISKWDIYSSLIFKRYSYYLGANKVDETRFDQTGEFYNFDIGIGSSINMNKDLKLFSELNYTLIDLASSDNRIKFKTILFSIGIIKEF
jgi:hypothetical protein